MTQRTPLTWATAALLALLLSTSHLLDGPDDIATAQAVADDLAQAQATAQATHNATTSVAAPALSTASNGETPTILASAEAVRK